MCAIAGILDLTYNESTIKKMLASMARRGPDGNGVAMRAGRCLLHTRLAIIDPDGGSQPMQCIWEERLYTIIYNGELYNTEEIRTQLLSLGHSFEGHSDTEVVLHAYAQWGEGCLAQFNGIFAFAVLCHDTGDVFLARDRMGVKPLYYMEYQGGLLFASEIKTILTYPGVPRELDREGVAQVLLLGPGKIPGNGVFRGIQEIKPGHYGRWTRGKLHIVRYWYLRDREHTASFEDTAAHVRILVLDAIGRQTVSDVPIGTFLSGGLDSSLITAVCASKYGHALPTFSLDFLQNDQYFTPGKFQPDSDNRYIHLMQEHLQTQHHWTVITPEDLMSQLENATQARDLPGMADVDFSLLHFCLEISQYVKVALSGECADEIFGGYPWYRDPQIRSTAGFPWAQNTTRRAAFLLPEYQIEAQCFVEDQYACTIAQCDILPGNSQEEISVKQMVNLNQQWFMQTLLDRKDRMSMYCGLEVRVPFCDHRIAEYLYGIPWEYKDYRNTEKGLLRYAMSGILPEQILWRKKCPYPKTYDPGYMQLVSDQLKALLQRADAPIYGILRKDKLQELLQAQDPCPWYGQLMGTPQTIAYMLQINHWLEHYGITIV